MSESPVLLRREGAVAVLTLNRPDALNALNAGLIAALAGHLDELEADDNIGAIVVTGSEKAFAAGADIKEMQPLSYMDVYVGNLLSDEYERLARAIGKAKAMELCMTGRMMDAEEAERAGLVSRIVPAASLMDEAMKTASTIAGLSRPSVLMAKESVNRAFETTLAEGVRFERRLFHSTFSTEDQKEGMSAFIAKRKPDFKHR